ncbi:MAG: helix-turn-helix transcriptional regulator [Bacteroidota bacterium]
MLAFNLRNVLKMKGIDEPYPWLRKRAISDDIIKRYLSGKVVKVDMRHLEIFCYDLNLRPNDFFIWQPDRHTRDIENHALQEIRSDQPLPDVDSIAKKLSTKSLRKLEEAARKIAEEEIEERKKNIEAKKKGKK